LNFLQFKLGAVSPVSVGCCYTLKWKVCERNSCVHVTITTRDVVIEEERLKCKREPDNESDRRYTIAIKKDGIIIGH